MKRKTYLTILWAAVAASGCLDLELLDEMRPLDAGTAEGADESGGDPETDGEGTGDDGNGEGSGDGAGVAPDTDPSDELPPVLTTPDCGPSESLNDQMCVAEAPVSASVRFATDEAAEITISPVEGLRAGVVSEPWVTAHHLAMTGLVVDNPTQVPIALKDVNGNQQEIVVSVSGSGGPPVAITEVLADPFGPEPGQEFVELVNVGLTDVDLSGWMIDDGGDANGGVFPAGTTLGAGQVAVIVSAAYDSDDDSDPTPDSAALVIVLEKSVGSNGLKNSEAESIELYDAQGVLVSQYQGQAGTPVEGCSAMRIFAELPDGDPLAFGLDILGSSTPGTAPTLP